MYRFSEKMVRWALWPCLLCLLPLGAGARAFAGEQKLVFASGATNGVYYEVAKAMSETVNRYARDEGLAAEAMITKGSVENIDLLGQGKAQFAIAQSDRVFQAYQGKGPWNKKGKQTNLRSLIPLYHECITIVARADSGMEQCGDLKGKRVALGGPGSGTRLNALDCLAACDLNKGNLAAMLDLAPQEAAKALQNGELDAFFYTVGHPNKFLTDLARQGKGIKFLGFGHYDKLHDKHPYYVQEWVPLKYYKGVGNKGREVETCGVYATLMTSKDVPVETVRKVVGILFNHFGELKKSNPVLHHKNKQDFFGRSFAIIAPHHQGMKDILKNH